MSVGRRFDHVVHATGNLDAAAMTFESLGFTLTPRAAHGDHMGTSNRLAQFAAENFIELLEVDRPGGITPHGFEAEPPTFSFGAHNRDAIGVRDGISMLVFQTDDTAADVARWRAAGIPTFEPFTFSRQAKLPDGSERTVSFSLGFVRFPQLPDVAIFVCENRARDIFWKPEFQTHDNGATGLRSVVIASAAPERDARLLHQLFDGEMATSHAGDFRVSCGPDQAVELRSFRSVAELDPTFRALSPDRSLIAGLQIATQDRDRIGTVTASANAHGAFIAWTQA